MFPTFKADPTNNVGVYDRFLDMIDGAVSFNPTLAIEILMPDNV